MEFPKEFDFHMRDPATRAIFVSENKAQGKSSCQNCGGIGLMFIFVATGGPFPSPSDGKVNKWTKNGWFVGKTYQYECPVCKGMGRHEDFLPGKTDQEIEKMDRTLLSRWDLKDS